MYLSHIYLSYISSHSLDSFEDIHFSFCVKQVFDKKKTKTKIKITPIFAYSNQDILLDTFCSDLFTSFLTTYVKTPTFSPRRKKKKERKAFYELK